jgi:hypothetical protein
LALTAVWKLSYAMKDGLLPIAGEKCGLVTRAMKSSNCVGTAHKPICLS